VFTCSAAPSASPAGVPFPATPAPAATTDPPADGRFALASSAPAHPASQQGPPPAGRPGPSAGTGQPPAAAGRPVRLSLLGPLRITADGHEVTGGLRKARELLAFLAVHPAGASGEAISEALWPGSRRGQRNLALRKARHMLRAATSLPAPMWIIHAGGRYHLDPALISTDLQDFTRALDHARHTAGDARLAACREAVSLYRGDLADGAGYEWAGPYAETARRRALDAWTVIAEILQPADPDQALEALDTALAHDSYNEYLYLKIMRLQAAAGRPEAVRRTLRLLETRLAGLGITASAQTRQAVASLLVTRRSP
jgi:DNA-binding SARP family transcriptional activator